MSLADLDNLTLGFVFDMFTESDYDNNGSIRKATQADYDAF